jgi:phosphate ABC transporter phosphate-binding protein
MRLVKVLAVLVAAGALVGCNNRPSNSAASSSGGRLEGAGSSFVKPIMSKWVEDYRKAVGLEVNYTSAGSGAGIQQMTNKIVNFGCTDAPMDLDQLQAALEKGGAVVHIPLVIGGAVPAYNLPGVDKPIHFTGQLLADIFLGKVKKWNEPALQELNKDVKLPDLPILVVTRSDPSGTNYIWADYLSKASKDWTLGVSVKVDWPGGETAKGSEGMAGKLKTEGAIGYVELLYVLKNKIQYGAVKNQEGEFILANLESVKAAADAWFAKNPIPDDLCYSLTDAPGRGSYPIAGTTWAVLYQKQPADKGRELVKFLRWVTHEGQEGCAGLFYVRLPQALVEKINQKLDKVDLQ